MKDYKIKNLGDVSKIIMGQAPHSKTYNTKKIGELLLRVNNFGNKYPTSDTYTTNPLKKSKDTDILLCVAGSCGKINFGINAAITRSIAAIRPGETLDKIFLYYFLLLKSKYFENLSTGAAQKIISKKLIEDTKIPIPKLSEQKRIVEKLDTCMEQIDKAIKNVEQNIQNVEDLFQSQLNEILLNNEKKTSLDELFNIKSSKRVLKKDWKTEGVPFYRGREVTELSKNGKVDNKLFISLEHYQSLIEKSGKPSEGDLIITAIGTIGNVYVIKKDEIFYFKDASILWGQKKEKINSEYVRYWFKSNLFFNQLNKGFGATVDSLTITKLKSIIIKLPQQISVQSKIVEKINSYKFKTDILLSNYNQELNALNK